MDTDLRIQGKALSTDIITRTFVRIPVAITVRC